MFQKLKYLLRSKATLQNMRHSADQSQESWIFNLMETLFKSDHDEGTSIFNFLWVLDFDDTLQMHSKNPKDKDVFLASKGLSLQVTLAEGSGHHRLIFHSSLMSLCRWPFTKTDDVACPYKSFITTGDRKFSDDRRFDYRCHPNHHCIFMNCHTTIRVDDFKL